MRNSVQTGGAGPAAFTFIELMVVLTVIGILSGLVASALDTYIEKAKIIKAINHIHKLEDEIDRYRVANRKLPGSLADIGRGNFKDPWGNPYEYLNFDNIHGKGKMRKDRYTVPINKFYDLYSMGPDGKSKPPLTASVSRDDIIRASDGDFIDSAYKY